MSHKSTRLSSSRTISYRSTQSHRVFGRHPFEIGTKGISDLDKIGQVGNSNKTMSCSPFEELGRHTPNLPTAASKAVYTYAKGGDARVEISPPDVPVILSV